MTKNPIPKVAIANQERKQVRVNIAKQALISLGPKVKFNSRTDMFKYIAEAINTYETLTKTTTKKGPCTRSGVYSIPEINIAVEKYWLTGVLLDNDVDLHETADAAARKIIMDLQIEVSNLKHEMEEQLRFLRDADNTNAKLQHYIESQDITALPKALAPDLELPQPSFSSDQEKLIAKLCQIIFKLECWAGGMIERSSDGALIDMGNDEEIASEQLTREYHEKVPVNKIREG